MDGSEELEMETVLAIDPGSDVSSWVLYDATTSMILGCADEVKNLDLVSVIPVTAIRDVAIEWIESYGVKHIGVHTFATCYWIGRFHQAAEAGGCTVEHIPRREVKRALALSANAKDSDVRQSILERFPATGRNSKGEITPVGTLKNPGPLHGIKGHCWAALGVAMAWQERLRGATKCNGA